MPLHLGHRQTQPTAYFSMEILLEPLIPTYSGGLGVLAGDFLRSAADLGLPLIGVSLVHHKGYFRQTLTEPGRQGEEPEPWDVSEKLTLMPRTVSVMIEGRRVVLRAWEYVIAGLTGEVPVYLLDSSSPENSDYDRTLTDFLYGGDSKYRLCQEIVLGIGGIKMLHRLGHAISTFHMNEGHASLLTLGILEYRLGEAQLGLADQQDVDEVRRRCVFTTHTPVPAGHDQFPKALVEQVLGGERLSALNVTKCCPDEYLNMTRLGLRFSRYINGVAMQHSEVSHRMFPDYPVHAITNGVHAARWLSRGFVSVFDEHIPDWRMDNLYLRYAIKIPCREIIAAHAFAKRDLLERIQQKTSAKFDDGVFTIGFARRAAIYKRADLIFSDLAKLKAIAANVGRLQLVFAGKAHPNDGAGKEMIRRVIEAGRSLNSDRLQFVYLPDYDVGHAKELTSGADLWLNTPERPLEASGTSGMKAALNGVPSLSVLDGWWIEGCLENITGWAIEGATPEQETKSLYDKLEKTIIPAFYSDPAGWAEIMRSAIAINGSFFNTQRMLEQYFHNAYLPSWECCNAEQRNGL